MSIPLPSKSVYDCRGQTFTKYGSDSRGIIDYQFNSLGYRSDIEYSVTDKDVGVYVGSSLTSGIGIPFDSCFAKISANALDAKCYQLSHGCTPIDNQEIYQILSKVNASSLAAKYFVVQFIDLDRRYNPATGQMHKSSDKEESIKLFLDTFSKITSLLSDKKWAFIGCDAACHEIPESVKKHPNCLSWNPPAVDWAGAGCHMGMRWHYMIGLGLAKKLK